VYSRDVAPETLFGRDVSKIRGVHKRKTGGVFVHEMDAKVAKAHLQKACMHDPDAACNERSAKRAVGNMRSSNQMEWEMFQDINPYLLEPTTSTFREDTNRDFQS